MPNLIHGQDPGGALRPIQVDDNGNLSVDIVSGVSVSTTITDGTLIQARQVSGSVDSINVLQIGGTAVAVNEGVDNDGTLRVVVAVDSTTSVQTKGFSRTTNPTAIADGSSVHASFDDLGRQVITPYQVRDLTNTAYLVLTTGTEATLLAAVAGVFLDCVQIVCANQSDAAVDVDFRSVLAGNVEFSITVPADATAGFVPSVPWPQGNTGNAWTADIADITGTTVNINAIFIRNV